jgi:hypothetical protein
LYDKNKKYFDSIEVKLLTDKIIEDWHAPFYKEKYSNILLEYCSNKEKDKYIYLFGNSVWRYDKKENLLDFLEPWNVEEERIRRGNIIYRYSVNAGTHDLINEYDKYIEDKFYNQGFWKRDWTYIDIHSYGRNITWINRWWIRDFTKKFIEKKRNEDYCIQWLTPNGNAPVCFADITYSYNYINHDLFINKFCTYYFDDNWKIQTLEKCREWFENIQDILSQKK